MAGNTVIHDLHAIALPAMNTVGGSNFIYRIRMKFIAGNVKFAADRVLTVNTKDSIVELIVSNGYIPAVDNTNGGNIIVPRITAAAVRQTLLPQPGCF